MIIWRGWGIVGLFLIVGGMALVMGLSGHNSSDTPAGVVAVGAGLLLGGAACAALGYWLNVVRPRSKAAEYLEGVRRELWQRVRAGAFQVAVGAPAPRDEAEAAQQVEYLVSQQSREVGRGLRNRNTLLLHPHSVAGRRRCRRRHHPHGPGGGRRDPVTPDRRGRPASGPVNRIVPSASGPPAAARPFHIS